VSAQVSLVTHLVFNPRKNGAECLNLMSEKKTLDSLEDFRLGWIKEGRSMAKQWRVASGHYSPMHG